MPPTNRTPVHRSPTQGDLFAAPTGGAPRTLPARVATATTEHTVTSLHREMKRSLNALGRVAVTGEVHSAKRNGSMQFFTLRERSAQIQVNVSPGRSKWCHVVEGDTVVVTGLVVTEQRWGRIAIDAEQCVPTGEGAVARLIEQARERLRADGVLDRPRRPLPTLPNRVALVCGDEAAVLHDFRTTANERFPGFAFDVVVANQTSPESIIDGLRRALRLDGVDVVVLARGGGDSTQLLPYSDETLCREIADAPVPVVVAIGHDADRPLCDDVADVRVATPTAAAVRVVPKRDELSDRLHSSLAACRRSLDVATDSAVSRLAHRIDLLQRAPVARLTTAEHRLALTAPNDVLRGALASHRTTLDRARFSHLVLARRSDAAAMLVRADRLVRPPAPHHARARLDALQARVAAANPDHVLARGFAIVRDAATGAIVRSSDALEEGQLLDVVLADGRVTVRVERSSPPGSAGGGAPADDRTMTAP